MPTVKTVPTLLGNKGKVHAKIPGSMAAWVFIYAELTEFGFFFIAFLLAKIYYPVAFYEGPAQIPITTGLLNTLVLLSSSFFVSRAMQAIKRDDKNTTLFWLVLTIFSGLTYCGIKTWEYQLNEQAGIGPRTNYYFASYYYITFNHLLHVLIGTCTIIFVTLLTALGYYNKSNHEGLESAASYWHMIDLVWILIFPLLYVLR
jgi:cytochrome c oxidase subunit 3